MSDPFKNAKIEAIADVLEFAQRSYKNHGTKESTHRTALAVYAIGEDQPWRMPTEFKHLQSVKHFGKLCHDRATEGGNIFTESGESQSIPGVIVNNEERNVFFTDEAIAILRPEGADFPEVGIYIPFTAAVAMVEMAIAETGANDDAGGGADASDDTPDGGDDSEASSAAENADNDDSDGTGNADDDSEPAPLATNLEVYTKQELLDMYGPADVGHSDTKATIIAAIITQWPLPKE